MYCPKCKDIFEEGSRRFCPTDGSRLISENEPERGRSGSIFANLIPKIEAVSDLDETLSNEPRPVLRPTRPPDIFAAEAPIQVSTPFFELDDPELEIPPPFEKPRVAPERIELSEEATRPLIRKVQPFEIPAGHVDLGGENRFPSPAADFSLDNPERFVGRIVKGRYAITEFLGGDETGLAYLGNDRIVEDRKVLVRILIEDGYDEVMSSILAEERVSLSHFSHPNIARLIDSGEFSNGMNFLVNEYVDALSVNDILTIHGKFDPHRTVRVIRQAANALSEAHQEGIIHRDIRPENLIIDASGDAEQIMLVNLGASNGEPNDHNIAYKAPEVLEGRVATVASDIYSLGVVAFEMLTGQMPFGGETAKDFLRAQNSGLKVAASEINPELPRAIDEVFERSFAINAADRFAKARDLGDALNVAMAQPLRPVVAVSEPPPIEAPPAPVAPSPEPAKTGTVISLEPVSTKPAATLSGSGKDEPSWVNRSPEKPDTGSSWKSIVFAVALLVLIAIIGMVWYLQTDNPTAVEVANNSSATNSVVPTTTDAPPMPRNIPQPANTNYYQNAKQDLKGDLLRNFVGFTLYYPKDWKLNGPQSGATPNARGKFLDISRLTPDGRMKEQMLISYYPSRGTFGQDEEKFPQMVKETNETLKKLLPGYQMVSEGPTKVNENWPAYEVKFQGGGSSPTGEKLVVWGRRLFIPAARPGTRNGFEITLLATSLSDGVHSVDDVGNLGELAAILETFEPGQNF